MNTRVRRADWNRLLDEALPAILESVAGTDVEEVTVNSPRASIRVRLQPEPAISVNGQPDPQSEDQPAFTAITARNVGVFRRAESGDDDPAARVGEPVEAGQAIGFVDTLNHYHPVEAAKAGELIGFYVEDGALVEYGQQLARIDSS